MKSTAIRNIRVYCVDLAKNKFQVHGFSGNGERCYQHTFTRTRFQAFFADPHKAGTLVVMEACGSSHHWARWLERRGYQTKLVPPQFVAKRRMGNKTDGNDADGIFAVHEDPRVHPVPVKSLAQQDGCAQHCVRELLIKQRTQCINQARGLLAERGCVAARGDAAFFEMLQRAERQQAGEEVTPAVAALMVVIAEQIRVIDLHIDVVDAQLAQALANSADAQRIDDIFGVGVVTATAVDAEFGGDVERFADARQFAAGLGITPHEHSSGEKRRLGPITKRGNPYLRKLLVQCAQSILNNSLGRDDNLCRFARRLIAQGKRHNTVIVAIANRLARTIYAVIKHRRSYQPNWRAQAV